MSRVARWQGTQLEMWWTAAAFGVATGSRSAPGAQLKAQLLLIVEVEKQLEFCLVKAGKGP